MVLQLVIATARLISREDTEVTSLGPHVSARAAECAVISHWRELGWRQAITDPATMPQGGMSETAALAPARDQHVLWKHVLTAVDHIAQTP
jgi:hypothetical protein